MAQSSASRLFVAGCGAPGSLRPPDPAAGMPEGHDHACRRPGHRDAGSRLDVWLAEHLPDLSRSRVQALIEAGHVTVDGAAPSRPHARSRAGLDVAVEIPRPQPAALAARGHPAATSCYEDADIIVVNKPAGLVVHPAAGHARGTLVNALLHHCRDLAGIGGELRPGIVHRLDKDTSGVDGRRPRTTRPWRRWSRSSRTATFARSTLAVVRGIPSPPAGTHRDPDRAQPARPQEDVRQPASGRTRRDPLRGRRGRSPRPPWCACGSKPAGPTRSACTWPTSATRSWATGSTAAARGHGRRAARLPRQMLHAHDWGSPTRPPRHAHGRPVPDDMQLSIATSAELRLTCAPRPAVKASALQTRGAQLDNGRALADECSCHNGGGLNDA